MGKTATRNESESSVEMSSEADWVDVMLFLSHDATRSTTMQKMAERSFFVILDMPDDCVVCEECVWVWWKNEGRTKRCTSLACMIVYCYVSGY